MLCLSQLQGIPEDEQKRLADDVKALSAQTVSSDAKLVALGSILLNTVGEGVLKGAVEFFRESHHGLVGRATFPPVTNADTDDKLESSAAPNGHAGVLPQA